MRKKLFALLLTLFMSMNVAVSMLPSFAATSSARKQALAYDMHSIGLTGVENARELVGYKTKDGRTVKFGKLIRTGELTNMTADDRKKLVKKYRLVKDIDFRSDRDIRSDGEDPKMTGVEYCRYPFSSSQNILTSMEGLELGKDLVVELATLNRGGDLVGTYFKAGYRVMYTSEQGIAMFKGFFKELLDANGGAVLWHCVSGKDRTGNAAILLLTVLGVDRKTIIEDYMLTNDYAADEIESSYDRILSLTGSRALANDLSLFSGVGRDWIKESFRTIEANYGSVDNFLKKEIGLTAKDYKKLQNAYLTPAK